MTKKRLNGMQLAAILVAIVAVLVCGGLTLLKQTGYASANREYMLNEVYLNSLKQEYADLCAVTPDVDVDQEQRTSAVQAGQAVAGYQNDYLLATADVSAQAKMGELMTRMQEYLDDDSRDLSGPWTSGWTTESQGRWRFVTLYETADKVMPVIWLFENKADNTLLGYVTGQYDTEAKLFSRLSSRQAKTESWMDATITTTTDGSEGSDIAPVDAPLLPDDVYLDENGVLRNADGTEYRVPEENTEELMTGGVASVAGFEEDMQAALERRRELLEGAEPSLAPMERAGWENE